MLDSEFLFYDRRAGRRHVQIALAFALVLPAACLAVLPYHTHPLPKVAVFIPVIDTMHVLFCCIVAAVFVSLASVLRARALVALGAGYVYVGIIAGAHGLAYPDAVTPTGLLGKPDTVTWLYFAWHAGLAFAIIVYALLKDMPRRASRLPACSLAACLGMAVLAAAATIWLATDGLPLISGPMHLRYAAYLGIALTVVALVPLWRGRRSILDLTLMLMLWAWLMEYVLTPAASRFSVGWYTGRTLGLVAGLFVLLILLIEMSRLYARTVMLVAAQKRERENRLMLGEAVGAFIAHELRQPLAAIGLNAYTAQKLGAQAPGHMAGGELAGVMDDLMRDSRRASDIIESTRALFGEAGGERRPTDLNQLVRDTLLMTSPQLRSHKVSVEVALDEGLPLVAVNRMQMQQVFMNLFINAAEAMSGVTQRPRALTIRSSSGDAGLVILVEDTGPSMVADMEDRIFDPFFTTKTHGTGMGLSICRSVVQAHGGSIQMAARTPFGASFEILLPHDAAGAVPAI